MNGKKNKENWNLYVLRYNFSGNYYVGTTEDFERRMGEHWRRDSDSEKRLPQWSPQNQSKKGFKFYWFKIENEGVERGEAEHCENRLAELLVDKIQNINNEKFAREIHVGSGLGIDCKGYATEFEPSPSLDEKIEKYLIEKENLNTKRGKFHIECHAIGYIGEYDNSQCNKSWEEVASIRFLNDNK